MVSQDPCKVTPFIIEKAERALPILIHRAKIEKQNMTYGQLSEKIDQIPVDIGRTLGYIRDCICEKKKCPLLNVIVVNKDTDLPGRNFLRGGTSHLSDEEYERLAREWQKKVFDYDKWDDLLK